MGATKGSRPPFSEEIPGAVAAPGEGMPRRSTMTPDLTSEIFSSPKFTCTMTINSPFDIMRNAAIQYPKLNCFGTLVDGKFVYDTYEEVEDTVIRLADGMRSTLGLSAGDAIGLMSKNRKEWTMSNLASNGIDVVVVAIYDTLGSESIAHIINHRQIEIIMSTSSHLEVLAQAKRECPCLKTVVLMDGDTANIEELKAQANGLNLLRWKDIVDAGKPDATFLPTSRDAMSQVMYTSGTTGTPKGVIILNRQFVAEVGSLRFIEDAFNIGLEPGMRTISYLPNAHIFAQALEIAFLSMGITLCISSGNIKKLAAEITMINPYALPAVPRILARFEDTIRSKVEKSSVVERMLFHGALAVQSFWLDTFKTRLSFLDALVFNKVRNALFSNIKLIFSGSAPLPAETQKFLTVALNTNIVQGFGMTETCAAVAATHPIYGVPGTIGGPMSNTIVKLRDVPEMNYLSTDKPYPRGEMVLKGTTIFTGYYKDETGETKKVLDENGWFRTGDVAMWTEDGSLKIIDRIKNIFKLQQGEYVAVEQVEAVYATSKYLAQIWVYGDSNKSYLIAVGVPSEEAVKDWVAEQNVGGDFKDICENENFKSTILQDLERLRAANKLKGYERIVNIHLEPEKDAMGMGFNIQNGLMTPSMKLKRNMLKLKYQTILDHLYAHQR